MFAAIYAATRPQCSGLFKHLQLTPFIAKGYSGAREESLIYFYLLYGMYQVEAVIPIERIIHVGLIGLIFSETRNCSQIIIYLVVVDKL